MRWLPVAALVAAVAVPAVVLMLFHSRAVEQEETVRDPVVVDGDAAAVPTAPPLPLCDDAALPPEQGVTEVPGDPHARGCNVHAAWDGRTLTVPGPPGEPARRLQLGREGDQLVMGDWDCDGRDTPGLYRPQNGQVLLFDGVATADGELARRAVRETGIQGATARAVDLGADGCDELLLEEPG